MTSICRSVVAVIALALSSSAFSQDVVENSTSLRAIRDPARTHNPACEDYLPRIGPILAQKMYEAADSYMGVPVTQIATRAFPEVDSWIRARVGIHDGRASCGSVCVTVPNRPYTVHGCVEETDGSRRDSCHTGSADAVGIGWARIDQVEVTGLRRGSLVCVSGKNWSDNLPRTLKVVATSSAAIDRLVGGWRCEGRCSGPTTIQKIGHQLQVRNEGAGAPWIDATLIGNRLYVAQRGWPTGTVNSSREIDWHNKTFWRR